jgi:hypothetical protein
MRLNIPSALLILFTQQMTTVPHGKKQDLLIITLLID